MAKTEPRTLSGFMELLPDEQILFNQMKKTIEETYQKYGSEIRQFDYFMKLLHLHNLL